jgi:hypothetical protein
VVWVPKKGATEKNVGVATRIIPDPRAAHFWDGTGATMRQWREVIGMQEDAWDMYFLYDRSAKWTGDLPPKPRFWMHQLGSLSEDRHLDPDVFAAQANAVLHGQ